MSVIKKSDLANHTNKYIRLEYKVAEEISGGFTSATWVTSKFKLIHHDLPNEKITFEDNAGKMFTWPTSIFRSITTAD